MAGVDGSWILKAGINGNERAAYGVQCLGGQFRRRRDTEAIFCFGNAEHALPKAPPLFVSPYKALLGSFFEKQGKWGKGSYKCWGEPANLPAEK